jgi:hypothetical protein
VLKTGVQLLNVADSDSTASGRLEHVVTSEGQINAVLVAVYMSAFRKVLSKMISVLTLPIQSR